MHGEVLNAHMSDAELVGANCIRPLHAGHTIGQQGGRCLALAAAAGHAGCSAPPAGKQASAMRGNCTVV